MNRLALILLSASAVSIANAQNGRRLTVGDPAPPIKVEAWVKGSPVKIKKGRVTVVEFWATWCRPCIESMPRLSALADKMRGKVDIVSVNVVDRSPAGEASPKSKVHAGRITKWVKENASKMRYSVALDDSANTMMKTWMSAAGQGGIPCAFVIDQQGRIAWIGHPEMGLAAVVEQVYAKKFDIKSAGAKYAGQMKAPFAELDEKNALAKLARGGDLTAIEKAYRARTKGANFPDIPAISLIAFELSKKHPIEALGFLKNRAQSDLRDSPTICGGALVYISPHFKGNKAATGALIAFSLETLKAVPPENAAIELAYHSRILLALGDVMGAREWLNRATAKLPDYKPEPHRLGIKKYIDDLRKRVDLASKR